MNKNILLIEDNDDDVLMIKRAFRKGKLTNKLQSAPNGKEGLEILEGENGSRIELILLDLNMEVMNGFDFLKKRKDLPNIKKIPVVVLTSSHRKEDIEKAYELGTNAYVEKPLDPKEFIDVLLKIEDFWIYICKKP